VTEAEFLDIMKDFKQKAEAVEHLHPDIFELGGPLYALDHAPWHDSADLGPLGITPDDLLPVPRRSPDFQKVIEHVFGWMHKKFQQKLYTTQFDDMHTAIQYRNYVIFLFAHELTKEHIQNDVDTLKDLYNIVLKSKSEGGCAGGWPPQQYT
jgi:hypothetical protein